MNANHPIAAVILGLLLSLPLSPAGAFSGLPLQQYNLDQLRLVGTIRSDETSRAIVETPDGKGYIVKEGTPIGRNNGFVIEIQKDRIVVEESFEGEDGEAVVRWEVLKLPVQEEG